MSSTVVIYTDGSSLGNPGKGGWAYLIWNKKENIVEEVGGSVKTATNNQMELLALKNSLEALVKYKTSEDVVIYLDSEYVQKGITSWIKNWKKNNWRTAAKKPVLNKDLWQEIDELFTKAINKHSIELKYVPGHKGIGGNETVDNVARTLAANGEWVLFQGTKEEFESIRNVKL